MLTLRISTCLPLGHFLCTTSRGTCNSATLNRFRLRSRNSTAHRKGINTDRRKLLQFPVVTCAFQLVGQDGHLTTTLIYDTDVYSIQTQTVFIAFECYKPLAVLSATRWLKCTRVKIAKRRAKKWGLGWSLVKIKASLHPDCRRGSCILYQN